jgi:hypothetical protein
MEICIHKKNGRVRIWDALSPYESLDEINKASWPVKPVLHYKDVLYKDLDEDRKKEYEAKECWVCK